MADSVPEGFTLDTPQPITHDLSVPEGFTLDKPEPPKNIKDEKSFEDALDAAMKMGGVPQGAIPAVKGLIQGFRELGHGAFERLPLPDTVKDPTAVGSWGDINTAYVNQVKDMQAQEQAYNQLNPDMSEIPGVGGTPTSQNLARGAAHILPYFLTKGKGVGDLAATSTAAGAVQPESPGENPALSPLTSGVAALTSGPLFGIVNKAIVKGYNSGALRAIIDSMRIPKAEIDANGPYGAIKNLADNADSFPADSPEAKQALKAKAFVSTVESKMDTPTAALALRSDVGGKYLSNSVEATRLYQARNAIGDTLGSIDTQPLSDQIHTILSDPGNQLKLGSNAATVKQVVSVLDSAGPNLSGLKGGDLNFVKNNPQAMQQFAGTPSQLTYSNLADMSDSIHGAARAAQGDPASVVYRQLANTIDGYLSDLSQKTGGKLAAADSAANSFYKNKVIPYQEKGIAQSLSDQTVNSNDIYKHFVSYSQDDPEQGRRLFNLMSPSGQQAVKAGIFSDALTAATDNTGYTDPALVKKFMDAIPNATGNYIKGQDMQMLTGLNNLLKAGAKPLGEGNTFYQRYMQMYGLENVGMGEFGKGSRQIVSPAFYNWLYAWAYKTPRMKDFWLAASKLNPDSPEAARAVVKFSRMVNQALTAEIANHPIVKQTAQSVGNTLQQEQ